MLADGLLRAHEQRPKCFMRWAVSETLVFLSFLFSFLHIELSLITVYYYIILALSESDRVL